MPSKWLHREQKLLRRQERKEQGKTFSDSTKKSKKDENRKQVRQTVNEHLEQLYNTNKNDD